MYSTTSAGLDAGTLREQLMGTVTVPGDAGWDAARQAWNLAVDQRPVAVAEPETVADVVAIVKFAAARGMRVAAQGTGHAATALAEGSLHDTILVKTHRMRVVEIDPDSRRARAQAGAIWADVAGPASEHGLAALAGSSHDVGVVGYCLGGGVSWRRASTASPPTAWWPCRSSPPTGASSGRRPPRGRPVLGRARRGRQLRHRHRHRARALPGGRALRRDARLPGRARRRGPARLARVGAHGARRGHLGGADPAASRRSRRSPARCSGQSFVMVEMAYLGDEAAGSELLAPLRALGPVMDTFATVAPADLLALHMDPPGPVPGVGDGALLDACRPRPSTRSRR